VNIKAFAFKSLFGGKPWYKSMVGWSILVLAVAETAVPLAGELGLASAEQSAVLSSYLEKLAAALAALGIRRKLPAHGNLAAVTLVAALSLGCNSVILKKGDVLVEGSGMGRGAIELTLEGNKVTALGCFDATTDWLSLRIIPAIVRGAVSIFFGRPDLGADSTSGPSAVGGCDALYSTQP
jgi:hypothetical protein